jgi:yeast amino acid transporter
MVAGEAKHPRKYMKSAFKTTYVRFALFFVMAALSVGIVVPYNDATLLGIYNGTSAGHGSAAASPYVIAMNNLSISVLPHIVNALLVTSIFSAGNAYTYYGSRSLYGLALEAKAPRVFAKCTAKGVPIYALCATMAFPCLAFLNVSSATATVLSWFINIVTGAGLINYIVICVTYIFFHRACAAQGIDRDTLPYKGWFQPWGAYIGAAFFSTVICVYGYSVFLPGKWSVSDFFTYYTMLLVAPVLFFGWKLVKGTRVIPAKEADLVWERPVVDEYEDMFREEKAMGKWSARILNLFGLAPGS